MKKKRKRIDRGLVAMQVGDQIVYVENPKPMSDEALLERFDADPNTVVYVVDEPKPRGDA